MGSRVRSEDRERVSAGLHQWGTPDRVSEWGVGCTRVRRLELMLRGCNNIMQLESIHNTSGSDA